MSGGIPPDLYYKQGGVLMTNTNKMMLKTVLNYAIGILAIVIALFIIFYL